ncbi:MAG: ribosome small subunit-dependent GTPase A [Bacteroidota bacterium]
MKGQVQRSTGSWYQIKNEAGELLNARLKGKFKLKNNKITNPLAVGDYVDYELEPESNNGIINEILPRENYIIRKSTHKTEHAHILASNVDQLILIATLAKPKTSLGFIDRFLITAEAYDIPATLVFNKSDILNKNGFEILDEIKDIYESIGYGFLSVSAKTGDGIEHFKTIIEGKTSLIAGHSGVGKSTILNEISDAIKQQTSEVSSFANKGVHTTTFAEMFSVNENTNVIDSPGIKELGLVEMEAEEIGHYFPEFRELMNDCKFNNCLHTHEPGCSVREALLNGEIAETRYNSYLSMLENEDNRR